MPTRLSFGKWWPLATSWVPITMSKRPCATSSSSWRSRSIDSTRSLDSTRMRLSGNSSAASCSSRSTPGPTGTKLFSARALRALLRRRHREAAVVADQPPPEAVIDQPGVAVLAGEPMAAGVAQRQRREAAAVEEQQRLLAALQRDLHRLGEPRRDEAPARRASRGADRSPRPTADAGRRTAPADADARSGRAARSPRFRPTASPRRARSGFSARARAPPPCRGRGSARRPPACRRGRAPHRRRSSPRSA